MLGVCMLQHTLRAEKLMVALAVKLDLLVTMDLAHGVVVGLAA